MLDVQLVKNIGKVRIASLLLKLCFLLDQPLGVLWREIVEGIAEERFCCRDEFRVGVAFSKCGASGRRSHGIDVGIVGEAGMRMMVKHGDLFDLRQELLVDLLNVRSRQWTRLTYGQRGQPGYCQQT